MSSPEGDLRLPLLLQVPLVVIPGGDLRLRLPLLLQVLLVVIPGGDLRLPLLFPTVDEEKSESITSASLYPAVSTKNHLSSPITTQLLTNQGHPRGI
ncbi:hypothetical protein [Tunturiibacter psychrotolerans]|uniref:hypothetical protein n=1 Tax=Tunturiibacter psychrotolerans TaxID=3069686 RepID=UPI003D2255F1